jgi:folate-dependent phosphoribosylglycinamide formyltransferase PurN
VILQRKCPVLANDTAQSLAERVFKEECVAYPQAIRQVLARVRAGAKT